MSEARGPDEARVPRRVWSGTLLLAAGRLLGSACNAVALLVLAHHLGAAEFGRLTFWLAAIGLLDVAADFGTASAVLQRGATDRGRFGAALGAARRLRLLLSGGGALALGTAAALAREPGWPWIALAGLQVLARVPELSTLAFQREIEWGTPVAVRAGGALTRLAAALLLVALDVRHAGPFLVANACCQAAVNLALHRLARARLPRPPFSARVRLGELWSAAWPLGLAGICQQLYFWIDNVFVRAWRGDVELGHYNAAVRLMGFLILVASLSTTSALPWLARRHDRGQLGSAAARLSLPLFVGASLALGALWPWTGAILRLLFPPGFEEAARAFRWLLVAAAVVHLGSGLLTALVASGRGRAVLAIAALSLLANVAGNTWLVPRFGMDGAAAATAATELLVTAGAWRALRRGGIVLDVRPATWLAAPLAFAVGAALSSAFA